MTSRGTVYLPSLYDLLIAYCDVRTRKPRRVGKHPLLAASYGKRKQPNSVLEKIPREEIKQEGSHE